VEQTGIEPVSLGLQSSTLTNSVTVPYSVFRCVSFHTLPKGEVHGILCNQRRTWTDIYLGMTLSLAFVMNWLTVSDFAFLSIWLLSGWDSNPRFLVYQTSALTAWLPDNVCSWGRIRTYDGAFAHWINSPEYSTSIPTQEFVEDRVGIEPTTWWLTANCSTSKLPILLSSRVVMLHRLHLIRVLYLLLYY
jgi:hypothetical protein